MRMSGRWFKTSAAAFALALTLASCGGGGASDAGGDSGGTTGGGTITAAAAYEGNNFHPSSTSSALAMGANWHVVEGLYELNMNTFEPYRALAAEEEPTQVSDTEYEVQLRADAKFSDGTPVTIDDVVMSFDRATAEGNIYAPMLSWLDTYSKKDDTTFTFTTKYPFSLVKERLALVKIVPAAATDDELTSKPIGTGPWAYSEITEQHIIFAPNEHYNGDFPAADEAMEWQIVKDDTARTTAMQEGTVSVMESVPADMAANVTSAGATVDSVQGFNLPFLMFNTQREPFDDVRVRQAFFYAIDTEKLINNAMSGLASPVTSFLPENHPNYNKASTVYTYDPEKSKKLLEEAGITNLDLTLLTTDSPWITALSPQIKNDLDAVGMNVTIQEEASSSLYSNYADAEEPNFDVVLAPGDPSVFGNDPDLLMNWWYGDNQWTQKRTQWGKTPEYAELRGILDEAVQIADEGERQAKWNEAYDFISEQVPLYPLFHRQISTGYYGEKLDNYKPINTTGLYFIGASTKN